MKAVLSGNVLTITIELTPGQVSKSGKSKIVGGTSGFAKTGIMVEGKELKVSVNAIIAI